jgi:hypothetical protein
MSGLSLNTNSPSSSVGKPRHQHQSARSSANKENARPRYAPKSNSKPGTPVSNADASMSWRKSDKPLSVDAKPFLPTPPLSVDAPAFTPTSADMEVKSEQAVVVPALNTQSPSGTPRARLVSPSLRNASGTPRTPGEEKFDYFNPYDVNAPKEFRTGIDAIYGLPFGGSLAFVFDGSKPHTVCKSMGSGLAELKVQISEKLTVEVVSGGMHDGDVAKILINGNDYSPNQKGVNILVVDTKTLDAYVGVFDTHTHIGNESSHLTRFLTAIPESHVVLVAIRYDAARRMHPEARQALKQRGVDIPEMDNAAVLEEVVKGVDPNRGADLLSMAATVNAFHCAEVLLKNGWDVNHQKRHGSRNTPLLDAVFHGSVDVVRVLLDAHANVDLQNKWQETAIDIATKLFGFHSLEEMVGIVLKKNQSVEKAQAADPMQE